MGFLYPRDVDQEITMTDRKGFYSLWWRAAGIGEPRPYQMRLLLHGGGAVVNKARQTGISTTGACKAIEEAALLDHKALIVANAEETAVHILSDYGTAFLDALVRMRACVEPSIWTKTLVQFPGGGEIRAFAANPSNVRGYPAHFIFLDEFAHFTKEIGMDRDMMEALAPGLAQVHGRMWVVSTPRGTANEFYRMVADADPRALFTVHWKENPDFGSSVREEPLPWGRRYWVEGFPKPFSESAFLQEFCNRFDVGSFEAIPLAALMAAVQRDDSGAWE